MGLRVTDEKIIKVVEEVMIEFNKEIVIALEKKECNAKSVTVKENSSICVEQKNKVLGYVGRPTKIDNKFVYAPSDLSKIKDKYKIELVLLAIPSLNVINKAKILESLQNLNITLRTLPSLHELTSGKIDLSHLRDLNINDLLGREPIGARSISNAKNITKKNVMITGGGGSIGSELCRQVLQLSPKTLIIIEINEYCLYQVIQEIKEKYPNTNVKIIPKLVSIMDFNILENIFKTYK